MAKKARKADGWESSGKTVEFAEKLGTFLGTTERQASQWLGQRKAIVQQLTAVRDQANKLLKELTGGAADMAVAVGIARGTRGAGKKRGRKKPMTAAEKKAVSLRMKKYWADRRAKTARKVATKKSKATDKGGAVGNG